MDRRTFQRLVRKLAVMHPSQPGVPLINARPRGNQEDRQRLEELIGRKPPARKTVEEMPRDQFQELLDKILITRDGLGKDLKVMEAKMEAAEKAAKDAVAKYKAIKARYDFTLLDIRTLQQYYMEGGFRFREHRT